MPELPEVETVVRSLAPHVTGRTIERAEFYSRFVTRGGFEKTARKLAGAAIAGVRRVGKQIFFDVTGGVLYVHLGMTGRLLWNGEAGKYTRAVLELDKGTLVYDDVRQLGRMEFFARMPKMVERVGPDALGIGFDEFYKRLQKRSAQIKVLLLNQTFIAGVGNIYADEMLFAARIHPRALASKLSKKRAVALHSALGEVLEAAIRHRGSSISNYVDGAGKAGGYQLLHNVYGRAGEACPRCGTTIKRIVLGQRGTHYCPRCQRA